MSQYLTVDADTSSLTAQRMRELASSSWASVPTTRLHDEAPDNAASEADREWFEDYPSRCIRLRYPVNGDEALFGGQPPKGYALALVFCPSDGVRFRLPVNATPDNPPPNYLLSGDPGVDQLLARKLSATLNEVRRVWGDEQVDRLQDALRECVASGARLRNWSWL